MRLPSTLTRTVWAGRSVMKVTVSWSPRGRVCNSLSVA
jgi:hypothetical protein